MVIMNKLYTIEEVAEKLNVSQMTVRRLIKRGDLPAYRVASVLRIADADLTKYLMEKRERGKADGRERKN